MRLTVEVPASAAGLETLGEQITRFSLRAGLPDRTAYRLRLAAEEIVGNIAEHGAPGSEVRVQVTLSDDRSAARLTICDDGPAFDPAAAAGAADPPDGRGADPDGGMGLRLVRELAWSLHYRRVGDRNETTVVLDGPAT